MRWHGLTTTAIGFGRRRVPTWFYSLASSLIMIIIYDPPSFSIYEFWSRGENADMCDSRGMLNARSNEFSFTEPWNQNLFPSHSFGWPFCFPFYTSKHIDSSSSRDCRSTGHRRLILFWTHEVFFSLLPVTAGNEEPNRQFLGFCLLIIWPTDPGLEYVSYRFDSDVTLWVVKNGRRVMDPLKEFLSAPPLIDIFLLKIWRNLIFM